MKTIIAITHLAEDSQVDLVARCAKKKGIKVVTICTNTVSFEPITLHQEMGQVSLRFGKTRVNPTGVWFATYPREDTLYSRKMSKYPYPGEYRSTVSQFVTDLRCVFSLVPHVPGPFDSVVKADSKPYVFKEAFGAGLRIPTETLNGNLTARRMLLGKKALYRKKLGFPSTVSFSRLSNNEEIVTTTNSMSTRDSSFLLWQWQTPIESIAHVRGFILDHKSWFVSWERKSSLTSAVDLREGNEEREWVPFDLPQSVLKKLVELRERLGIRFCCPEFLLNAKGELILIDINPCGDWQGFFPDSTAKEIASAIASVF